MGVLSGYSKQVHRRCLGPQLTVWALLVLIHVQESHSKHGCFCGPSKSDEQALSSEQEGLGHRGQDRVPEVLFLGEENRSLWAEQGPKKEVLERCKLGCSAAINGFNWSSSFSAQSFFGSKMLLAEVLVPLEKTGRF